MRKERAARPRRRGREASDADRAAVARLLAGLSRAPDLLIEHLHRLQDAEGCLREGRLLALAEAMRLAPVEVYETATFYHNFQVLPDEAPQPPPIRIQVCDSLPCQLAGAEALKQALASAACADMEIGHAACLGRCHEAPAVRIGARCVTGATAGRVLDAARGPVEPETLPAYPHLAASRAGGGYRQFERVRAGGKAEAERVLDEIERGGLRGLGGAGFPAARKWRMVLAGPAPRLMAVNADESEPGTFKDRHYLLADPHRFIEGMFIAAHVVGAERIFIFLRDEYADIRRLLEHALADASAAFPGLPPVELRRGAGAYICGEESAMLESLEGRRALPRHKPPYPSSVGLFGRPTLINNVETLYWVRDLLEGGADLFAAPGRRGRRGLRSFSVSGRVAEPGVKLAPAGISARELIEEYCGGMQPGHRFHAYLPGGASGGILPATLGDIPLDFGTIEEHGALIGSAALIVLSDRDDLRQAARNLMAFFKDESCGQCTPCRLGTEKALQLMAGERWPREELADLCKVMADASICGLGQAAPNGVLSLYRHFAGEIAR
ncbi:MAG: NAD(P)H-dependent oxidoreductase subunit E [Alphaproteobacteria bacterium]|nr:NAD(P)H-dependent oxidoreductase subunit E [Alphaproteobacteria bacterium]